MSFVGEVLEGGVFGRCEVLLKIYINYYIINRKKICRTLILVIHMCEIQKVLYCNFFFSNLIIIHKSNIYSYSIHIKISLTFSLK